MKHIFLIILASLVSGCATTGEAALWKCSATGMTNYYYTGGDYATIQLQGYASGGRYSVTKNADGTEVTGNTGNGTPFACVKSK